MISLLNSLISSKSMNSKQWLEASGMEKRRPSTLPPPYTTNHVKGLVGAQHIPRVTNIQSLIVGVNLFFGALGLRDGGAVAFSITFERTGLGN